MSVLYNEHDAYPAAWLRNLIDAGHIAPGTVDERSVADLEPKDLAGVTQFHAFAGIGVWSHALRLAGWADDAPVWTGSCPCQPFSAAGRRKGHADERHLWPAWFHLIRECRPPVIFGEQVASGDGLAWLDAVQSDLEGEGYAVGALDLCAAGVGAPHIRQRLFFVAHDLSARCGEGATGEYRSGDGSGRSWVERITGVNCADGGLAESSGTERGQGRSGRSGGAGRGTHAEPARPSNARLLGEPLGAGLEGHAGHERDGREPGRERAHEAGSVAAAGESCGVEHAERQGREVALLDTGGGPAATGERQADELGGRRQPSFWSDLAWLPCRDGKVRPTQPGLFPLAHGVAARVGRLRAYGNAIVAPLAAEFVRAYMEVNR